MANILHNTSDNRFAKKAGILQFEVGADTYQLKFTQRFFTSINLDSFDEDFIDNQNPIWSQVSNKVGDAEIDLKDTVDLYDTANPATDVNTISYWRAQIAAGTPAQVTLITVKNSPNAASNPFAREKFTGNIIDVTNEEVINQALLDATLSIRLTEYVSGIRSAA